MHQKTVNALTIDVEDYYHVTNLERCVRRSEWEQYPSRVDANTHRLLDLLAAAGVRATFFVLGWVAERRPALVRAIRAAGHEVGCHSHLHRLVYEQGPREFRADLRRARGVLRDILGEDVCAYRAPSFSITARSLWALDVLAELGMRYDSSIYPVRHDRYGVPDAPRWPFRARVGDDTLLELPPVSLRVLGTNLPVGEFEGGLAVTASGTACAGGSSAGPVPAAPSRRGSNR